MLLTKLLSITCSSIYHSLGTLLAPLVIISLAHATWQPWTVNDFVKHANQTLQQQQLSTKLFTPTNVTHRAELIYVVLDSNQADLSVELAVVAQGHGQQQIVKVFRSSVNNQQALKVAFKDNNTVGLGKISPAIQSMVDIATVYTSGNSKYTSMALLENLQTIYNAVSPTQALVTKIFKVQEDNFYLMCTKLYCSIETYPFETTTHRQQQQSTQYLETIPSTSSNELPHIKVELQNLTLESSEPEVVDTTLD